MTDTKINLADCRWVRRADDTLSLMLAGRVVARIVPQPGAEDEIAMWCVGGSLTDKATVGAYAAAGWHQFDLYPGMPWEACAKRVEAEIDNMHPGSLPVPERTGTCHAQ